LDAYIHITSVTSKNSDGNMIKNKQDLTFYLVADKFSLGITYNKPKLKDDVWKFQIALRKVEYYKNVKTAFMRKILLSFYQLKKHRLGLLLGFDIPENVFGAGLRINHFGNIIINPSAKIGMWCDIHQGVNIGSNNSSSGELLVPTIGSNVWIGPGAKIFGNINIGNGVQIGANAVVNKGFINSVTLGGVPAKVISDTGTEIISVAASEVRMLRFLKENSQFKSYFE
jgi:serine O-acetyltransferase